MIRTTLGPSFNFSSPEPLTRRFTENTAPTIFRNHDITPDGRFIGVIQNSSLEDSPTPAAPVIHVVMNWIEELKQRLPVPYSGRYPGETGTPRHRDTEFTQKIDAAARQDI